jgi:16S rRNA (guanine966-N2)-methyltransferase
VDRALATLSGPFDLVLLDPPYADVAAPAFRDVLAGAARLLDPAGGVVLEHASPDEPPVVAGLEVDRSRRYGDTTITLYRPAMAPEAL